MFLYGQKMKMEMIVFIIGIIIGLACGNPHPKSELTLQPPEHEVVRTKNSASIVTCNASSGAKVNWLDPAGKPISDLKGRVHVDRRSSDTQEQIFLIFMKIAQSDRGIWTCVSDSVSYNKTFNLIYIEDTYFEDTPLEQTARVNETATVRCGPRGDPKPTVSWHYNGAQIPVPSNKYNKTEKGLVIADVSIEDRGEYTCRAFQVSNYTATLVEKIITLNIQHKPIWHRASAEQAYGYLTGTVNLTCKAEANPAANFSWHRNGKLIPKGSGKRFDYTHISVLEVSITDRTVYGDYVCKAGNFMGTMERVITLVEGYRPDPPTQVALRGITPDTLDIEIRGYKLPVGLSTLAPQPDNLPIIGYRFQIMLAPPIIVNEVPKENIEQGQSNEVINLTSPTPVVFEEIEESLWVNASQLDFGIEDGATYLLTGLQHDMPYVVRVMSRNPAGYSLPSATLRAHTLRLQPHSVFGAASSNRPSFLASGTILLSSVALLAGILNQPVRYGRKQSPSHPEGRSRLNTFLNQRC